MTKNELLDVIATLLLDEESIEVADRVDDNTIGIQLADGSRYFLELQDA